MEQRIAELANCRIAEFNPTPKVIFTRMDEIRRLMLPFADSGIYESPNLVGQRRVAD
jgi:hypothetical protein